MDGKNTYKFFFSLLIMFISISSFAQELKVYGNVIDAENGETLSHVNVALISDDNYVISQTLTDSKGKFKFDALESGNYRLKFSLFGYSDTSVSINGLDGNYEVKDIKMNIISYQLEGVTVNAEMMDQGVDRMTFFPSQRMRESSQDALDVIRLLNMPGIKFDIVNHSFSSLNNGSIQIRIDGVISSQKDLIALQPQDIARIEYIDNPGIMAKVYLLSFWSGLVITLSVFRVGRVFPKA